MNFKDILKVVAVGALVYGAYKIGQKNGEKKHRQLSRPLDSEPAEDAEIVEDMTEEDYIRQIINSLMNKPNKTRKDRDTLELLQLKLKQLLNGKL